MHPPLLKSTVGRRKNQRFKGCTKDTSSTTRKKGQHRCDVYHGYGHRWNTCKEGNAEDIAGLLAERGPPKKKKKKNEAIQESSENSIVPVVSRPTPMYFPPSQGCSTSSGKTEKSACGSSQPLPTLETTPPPSKLSGKRERASAQGKAKAKKAQALVSVPSQSPAMCTRSKTPESPTMTTRSKRKIQD